MSTQYRTLEYTEETIAQTCTVHALSPQYHTKTSIHLLVHTLPYNDNLWLCLSLLGLYLL
jgi:hypothetical protein